MKTSRLLFAAGACAVAALGAGCSGARDAGPGDPPLPENTGAIVAKLTNVPSDVQCVEIDTSDWRTPQVRADVTPGGSSEIRVAPLTPGDVWVSGVAYDTPCYAVPWYGDAGPSANETWEADSTYLPIVSGQTTHADLHFHQLGSADISVEWDTCDPDASFGCGDIDGGPPPDWDAWPPPDIDAGPPPSADAGFFARKHE